MRDYLMVCDGIFYWAIYNCALITYEGKYIIVAFSITRCNNILLSWYRIGPHSAMEHPVVKKRKKKKKERTAQKNLYDSLEPLSANSN